MMSEQTWNRNFPNYQLACNNMARRESEKLLMHQWHLFYMYVQECLAKTKDTEMYDYPNAIQMCEQHWWD